VTLTNEQVDQYRRDGYLVFPNLFSREEIQALLSRLSAYVEDERPVPEGVHFQIEPGVRRGDAVAESKMDAFRKVEGLVEHDDVFGDYARDPKLMDVLIPLLGPDIKMFRDALMMKPARHGSAKPYHQDSAYWSIDPPNLASVWMALDDATLENGCMRIIPGSHTAGTMEHRQIDDFQVDESQLDLSNEISVPLEAGGCLVFHSLLLHATSPNHSDSPRRAMITSYMSATSRFTGSGQPKFMTIHGRSHEGCV
jgi:phytanoyl-CoA hydroxylase